MHIHIKTHEQSLNSKNFINKPVSNKNSKGSIRQFQVSFQNKLRKIKYFCSVHFIFLNFYEIKKFPTLFLFYISISGIQACHTTSRICMYTYVILSENSV